MTKHYRAKEPSYGFRGQYWEKGQVAENVQHDEGIPLHFELITGIEPVPEQEEPELATLSEIADHEYGKPEITKPKSRKK